MKAIWYEKQGDASEVLIYGEMEKPTPQNDEVLIKVYYSGLNPLIQNGGSVSGDRNTLFILLFLIVMDRG